MKKMSVISYIVGSLLLLISCFTLNITLTWWLGAFAVLFLTLGCIFQFNVRRQPVYQPSRIRNGHPGRY